MPISNVKFTKVTTPDELPTVYIDTDKSCAFSGFLTSDRELIADAIASNVENQIMLTEEVEKVFLSFTVEMPYRLSEAGTEYQSTKITLQNKRELTVTTVFNTKTLTTQYLDKKNISYTRLNLNSEGNIYT